MSLGVAIKAPEGIVLAAESRVTLGAQGPAGLAIQVNFDNVTKLLSLSQPHHYVGIVTYGQAVIGLRNAQSYMPEFEAELGEERLTVEEYARRLSDFFSARWEEAANLGQVPRPYTGPNMVFLVGGYDPGEAYGHVFELAVPGRPEVSERNAGVGQFGITWGGQREIVDRLIKGYDERMLPALQQALSLEPDQMQRVGQAFRQFELVLPILAMPLQDVVDLAIFMIRTTITAQSLAATVRGCGGPIDVATVTRSEGIRFVQRKEVVGEMFPDALERRL